MATILSATQGLLKIANLAATREFLAQLAPLNPAQRQAQLLTQLKLLADARVTGDLRLQVLEALRSAILESQHARSRDYWGKPVPFDNDTREIFERTVATWRTLADAYESLITDMAEASPDLAEHAEVICYRALRYTGFAMSAHNRAYHEIPGALWEQLHHLYAFSESAGVTDMPVPEGGGNSTVGLSYLQTVLAQRAQPDALSLLQMNTVDRALAQWVGLGRISVAQPGVADDTEFALGIDLDSCAGAQQLMQYTGGNLRRLASRASRPAMAGQRERARAPGARARDSRCGMRAPCLADQQAGQRRDQHDGADHVDQEHEGQQRTDIGLELQRRRLVESLCLSCCTWKRIRVVRGVWQTREECLNFVRCLTFRTSPERAV